MTFVKSRRMNGVLILILERGKVNALNETVVDELTEAFDDLVKDDGVKAIVLTGRDRFFSFGFDVPEFFGFPKDDFMRFLRKFTQLYAKIFIFPKPVLAALNGHAIGGGCMLALACDERIMVPGKAKISLNEIGFGSTVFAGSIEMLRFCVGRKNAQTILFSGDMFTAEEALRLGIIDRIVSEEKLLEESLKRAVELGEKQAAAYRSMKKLLRRPTAENMARREEESLREFVEIWYSNETRAFLREIKIRE